MFRDDPGGRDLGPLSRDVLAVLIEHTDDTEGISREEAVELIKTASASSEDRFWGTADPATIDAEIEGVLDGLVNRGYLYEVEDELRVTERDVLE